MHSAYSNFRRSAQLARAGRACWFVATDGVPLPTSTDATGISFRNSEAFTFAANAEGMDVVDIESSFFGTNNVFAGQAIGTRIFVHEVSHVVCGTKDVKKGNTRYAWYGIGPHAGYPASDCVQNAENWAFFAGDCVGALSDGERTRALKII